MQSSRLNVNSPPRLPNVHGSSSSRPLRVMVAHPHPVVAYGVRNAVAPYPDLALVSEVTQIGAISPAIEVQRVDALVCAYEFENDMLPDGQHLLRKLRHEHPSLKIVVVTGFLSESPLTAHAKQLGVNAVLSQSSLNADTLVATLQCLMAGRVLPENELPARDITVDSPLAARMRSLSLGELEALRHYLRELSDHRIAWLRERAHKTGGNQRSLALQKLGIDNIPRHFRDEALMSLAPWLIG